MASATTNTSPVNSPIANPTNSPMASPVANPAAPIPPVPVYLDFTDLRNEGITHLGNLTGRIWTDYNVHDPGITILEALCYALVDLDYRTKLPAADIFARLPSAKGPDTNFFSPAQILANNPLTILDYRKLLSDIEGVRNAWLEVAGDTTVNGLYRIFIELEEGVDEPTVLTAVRQALDTHRNLCEDISAIIPLGKQRLGVCAIVELNTDADPAQVYLDMMATLGDFLSPSPHFYTLQEMLDKNKSIDAVFAGRPYNTSISHGFIDTDELESIQLKKEVHLSDLYKSLFEVGGIKTIRDLQWKPCGGTPSGSWKYGIPENSVIDFTPECCGIQFLRNGKPIPFDATQYEAMLQVSMKKNLYTSALPNLDLAFPKGTFRDDLADYYSIQNDFPNAYGISRGGVPADAPMARKAWALQLKGFLLFFDQLLADYLSQLANIRDLFSMGGGAGGQTYFLNPLDNGDDPDGPNYVPDVQRLWRSYVDEDLAALLGTDGAALVFPAAAAITQLPADITPLDYADWGELQDVITRLKADFEAGPTINYLSLQNQFFYYITTSSPGMVLVSKKTFTNQADAQKHAAYVLNNGLTDGSYSLFSISGNHFTFTLQYNASPVADILQSGLEDTALYTRRRQYFLDHLLSRFAERFTDYALLQWGPADPLKRAQAQIGVEENYLSQYAILSSERGKAADYSVTKWNSDNISGVEKKWKALIGSGSPRRQNLCNFIVQQLDNQYRFTLKIGDKTFFEPTDTLPSEAAAQLAAEQLLKALAERSNYFVSSSDTVFSIGVTYAPNHTATLTDHYPSEIYANTIADRLSALFAQKPSQRDITEIIADKPEEPSRWKFRYYLGYEDNDRVAFDSVADYDSAATAMETLRSFWDKLSVIHLQQEQGGLTLRADDTTIPTATATPAPAADPTPLLQLQQAIQQAVTQPAATNYFTTTLDDISQQGRFIWQLADLDQHVAFCTHDYPDQASAEKDKEQLAALLIRGVKYLEICMDGAATRKRKDSATGEYGYHYLVRCHNYYYSSGREMILFESIKGYPTPEAAKQAFTDNYLTLLAQAAQESSYGPIISLTQLISNNPPTDGPIVFVPKETKVALGGADADVIKKLVVMAVTFPIRKDGSYYYCAFTIPNPDGVAFEWRSTRRFPTIGEAQLDFAFFIRLLHYPGNLFIDIDESPDTGTTPTTGDATPTPIWHIYLREVLAESAGRFISADEAWGPKGVERMIGALREEGSVISYQQDDCTNTFLVSCGQPVLKHLSTYSTPAARDEAKQLLVSQAGKWDPKANNAYRETDTLVLTDAQGQPFTKAAITDTAAEDIQLVLALLDKISDHSNKFIVKDEIAQLTSADGGTVIALSTRAGTSLEDWKTQLEQFADSYPFVAGTDGRFSVELYLPGSNQLAWKSTCLHNTSADAQAALEAGITLLSHTEDYLSFFTSDCRCFGIAFSDPNDKIAIHPQSYNSRDRVLGIVQRMRAAVNVEGLHLIEHILLRGSAPAAGSSPAPSPCVFTPGSDPISFIATVVLPAWPDKFDQQDNKIVLENALYREAPAHVLLRVLWLSPRDCYDFETIYKAWLRAHTPDLAHYLFSTSFAPMADLQPCHPCPAPPASTDSCADNLAASRAKQLPLFSGQVSELYHWTSEPPAPAPPTPEPHAPAPEPPTTEQQPPQ